MYLSTLLGVIPSAWDVGILASWLLLLTATCLYMHIFVVLSNLVKVATKRVALFPSSDDKKPCPDYHDVNCQSAHLQNISMVSSLYPPIPAYTHQQSR
jgi:hypothetical protein